MDNRVKSLAKAWTALAMMLVFPPVMALFDGSLHQTSAVPPATLKYILIVQAVMGLLIGASSLFSWTSGRLNIFLLLGAGLGTCFSAIASILLGRSIPLPGIAGYFALAVPTVVFGTMTVLTLFCYWNQGSGKNPANR